MISDDDRYGEFSTCFACGYVYEAPVPDPRLILEQARLAAGKLTRPQPSRGAVRLERWS